MNKTISIILILSIFPLFLLPGANQPREIRLAREVFNLPEDGFFKYGVDTIVTGDEIFILENRSHKIYKFRVDGNFKFIKTVGKKGKGPSDLFLPAELSFSGSIIAVKDQEGISFFDKNGLFHDKFRLFSPRISFVFVNEKVYFASSNPSQKTLIGIYTKKGKLLKDFGEKFLSIDPKIHKKPNPFFIESYFYKGKLLTDGTSLFYLNTKFAKVIVFDLEGKKVFEKDISSLFGESGKKIVAENKAMLASGMKADKKNPYMYSEYKVFQDACLFKDKIYILSTSLNVPSAEEGSKEKNVHNGNCIYMIDKKSFSCETKFLLELKEGERIHSFAVTEKKGSFIFYAPMYTGEGTEIATFKAK